jgi:hypothetical protein
LCDLSSLRSLLLLQPTYMSDNASTCGEHHDVLAPLSALQLLTRLQLPAVRRVQLRALQLPQLQRLQVKLRRVEDGGQVQLSHLTVLDRLTVIKNCNSSGNTGMTSEEQLPQDLQELCWDECRQGHRSVQPLLGVSRLQKLRLHFGRQPPAADQVEQLSTLSSLREVSLAYFASPVPCIEAAAAAAWQALPLVGLRLADINMVSAALLQQLQQLQGLTALELSIEDYGEQAQVTFSEVAEMVQNLPALQCLSLQCLRFKATVEANEDDNGDGVVEEQGSRRGMYHNAAGVAELLQAIGSLSVLDSAYVWLRLKLLKAAAQQVTDRLPQLVGSLLAQVDVPLNQRYCS